MPGEHDQQDGGAAGAQHHAPEPLLGAAGRGTASAITTALSPDNRMLIPMICSAASQKAGRIISEPERPPWSHICRRIHHAAESNSRRRPQPTGPPGRMASLGRAALRR